MSDFSKVARLDRTTLVRNLKPLISSGLIELNDISKSNAKLLILSQKVLNLQLLHKIIGKMHKILLKRI
ncbi:hypothetical protein MASR2M54_18690 [Aliarcobacter cryaerophilus]